MSFTRRAVVSAGALAAGAYGLSCLFRRSFATTPVSLVADPDGLLDLAPGFSYQIIDRAGMRMSDDENVPTLPDGMACFQASDGALVLMRNHECVNATGGVTRVVLDPTTYERRSSNWVLRGTTRNCAGGISPWGWLSCEETVDPGHGYVYVCPIDATSAASRTKVVGYGRFNHEAAAVDPVSNTCYLTEDRGNGCLYRFVPTNTNTPFEGKLQALRIGASSLDTKTGYHVGNVWQVSWVDLPDPDPTVDTLRQTGKSSGAATFSRGEGIWFFEGSIYFAASDGGPVGGGQIFKLTPTAIGGTLELIAQSQDRNVLDMPDNITLSPAGDVYMAEDGYGLGGDDYLRILRPDGSIEDFARTSTGELAGACFSPDGRALFVNLQVPAVTVVITGPFTGPGEQGGQGGHRSQAG